MNKILLIVQREYFSRVKKKSFLLMTFLVPLLIIGMYALIFALSMQGGDEVATVTVVDETGIFAGKFKDNRTLDFEEGLPNLQLAKANLQTNRDLFVLYIPSDIEKGAKSELLSQKKAGLILLQSIEEQMNSILKERMLTRAGIDPRTLAQIDPKISILTKEITAEGEKSSNAGATYGIGIAAAILIYMSLFIYGAQVMRGVIEEKTNRIIEVVISSVKPFQLMMGKIIGIGLVGLTQFLLWIILSASLITVSGNFIDKKELSKYQTESASQNGPGKIQTPGPSPASNVIEAIETIPFGYILSIFLIYFLGGYMLYSALFAAVGSAVDNETETQQFMFPITLPLLFTYIMSFSFIINNPDSSLSFWLSMIPFTSPIAMMVRVPFGVPLWQLALSASLLVAGFIFTTWIASRIYRVGILMYGKRSSYKELLKWFMYKE